MMDRRGKNGMLEQWNIGKEQQEREYWENHAFKS
jgi:hypothetical protein